MMMSRLAVPPSIRSPSSPPLAGNGTSGDHNDNVIDGNNDDIELGNKSSQPAKPPRRKISRVSSAYENDSIVIEGPSASLPSAPADSQMPASFVPLPQMASFSVTADKLPIQDIELNGDVSAKIILKHICIYYVRVFPGIMSLCIYSFVRPCCTLSRCFVLFHFVDSLDYGRLYLMACCGLVVHMAVSCFAVCSMHTNMPLLLTYKYVTMICERFY